MGGRAMGSLGFAGAQPNLRDTFVGWVEQREAQHSPHDLLWGLTSEALPPEAPGWAQQVVQAGLPVVIRRATSAAGCIPVGLRGTTRAERLAAWLAPTAVRERCSPESLRPASTCRDLPVFATLARLQPLLDEQGLRWGPIGAAGYELASGWPALHAESDLDLLIRSDSPLSRDQARTLLAALQNCALCRLDIQLETPKGGVALADWAGYAARVLIKTDTGPQLVSDPWHGAHAA